MLVCVRVRGARSCAAVDRKAGNASRRSERYVSLRNREDFRRVFRSGRRSGSQGLTVLTLKGPSEVPRIGIVAGKKVGNAVNRNRAKRRLREAADRADLRPWTDYILIAGHDCNEVAFSNLVDAISGKDWQ